jgi:hypothetical protein
MLKKHQEALQALRDDLGYQPLTRIWAKVEILAGLLVAAFGLFLGDEAVKTQTIVFPWISLLPGLLLFTLGGYLALAGHRSHLYQSNNELIAYLVSAIDDIKVKGSMT